MAAADRPITFHDRLLVEAVRSLEQDGANLLSDASAEEAGRSAGGNLEHRLVRRAEALPAADGLRAALSHVSAVVGWTIALAALIAFIAGAGAVRAALSLQPPVVNFYWVFGAVLGVQTIALLLWVGVMLITAMRRGKPAPGAVMSLGSLVLAAARWLSARAGKSEAHRAAMEAIGRIHTRRLGRWTFSAITHGLWLAFNVGALLMVFVLLTTRQYTFVWETTILSEREYVRLTQAISHLPNAAGFPVPDEGQIAASRWVGDPARLGPMAQESRQAWAGLLVGGIIVYGFGPRLLLLGLSLGGRRTWRNAYRIDTDHPAYALLRERLMPHARRLQPPAVSRPYKSDEPASPSHAQAGAGPPAILGLELSLPRTGWPPPAAAQWDDLGLIETRDDRHRAIERLRTGERPHTAVIVCDLTATPDRGIERFIRNVAELVPPAVALTGGESLRKRGYGEQEVASRVNDWRDVCIRAGVTAHRIIELDLDHITTGGMARLAMLAGDEPSPPASVRRIEPAFALIAEEAARWLASAESPDAKAQADLHQRIAQLYRDDSPSWRSLLHAPASLNPAQLTDQFRAGAERTLALLPHRLKASPKWLAAGAMSGAMSCIAAAALISPAAIAALPAWSAIGAAIAGVLQWSGAAGIEAADAREAARGVEIDDAVRAAALFALLLELQGRDEATITRMLDRIIGDDDRELHTHGDVRAWLDELRHRLDLALAEGAA